MSKSRVRVTRLDTAHEEGFFDAIDLVLFTGLALVLAGIGLAAAIKAAERKLARLKAIDPSTLTVTVEKY